MAEPFLIMSRTPESDVETRVNLVFDDPFTFGMAFVDAARVIARSFSDQDGGIEQAYLDRIKQGFDAEWSRPATDVELTQKPAMCVCGHAMADHIEGLDSCSLCDCHEFRDAAAVTQTVED